MTIKTKWEFEDKVYLKTDSDQCEYIITGIQVRPGGIILLMISCMGEEISVYDFEVSRERDISKILNYIQNDE